MSRITDRNIEYYRAVTIRDSDPRGSFYPDKNNFIAVEFRINRSYFSCRSTDPRNRTCRHICSRPETFLAMKYFCGLKYFYLAALLTDTASFSTLVSLAGIPHCVHGRELVRIKLTAGRHLVIFQKLKIILQCKL